MLLIIIYICNLFFFKSQNRFFLHLFHMCYSNKSQALNSLCHFLSSFFFLAKKPRIFLPMFCSHREPILPPVLILFFNVRSYGQAVCDDSFYTLSVQSLYSLDFLVFCELFLILVFLYFVKVFF